MLDKVKTALLTMARYSWEQGVCAQAFLEAGDDDVVVGLCYDAVNRQSPDGRLGNLGHQSGVTDPVVIVPALIRACKLTNDPKLRAALDLAMEWSLKTAPRSANGIVYHMDNSKQFWVDSLYMFPATLMEAGHPDEAVKQADGYIKALWDADKGLFRHIWDDDKQSFQVAEFWGVGNGWALAGLSRLIVGLPDQYENARKQYVDIVTKTIKAALPLCDNGMFHNFLDKPDSFLELNFGQMLAYTIFKGIKHGWLYKGLLDDGIAIRKTVHEHVTNYGLVTPVCGAPSFDHPGIAPEGQSFYILMETAYAEVSCEVQK